jgi:biopolymer transport protein ExbD
MEFKLQPLWEERKRVGIELNMAPLIDIVFLLLLFFMLSSSFARPSGIKITLPAARTAKTQPKTALVISINEDNKIYLNGRKVNLMDLLKVLKEEVKGVRRKSLIIRADKNINLGLAVKVMDIAREAKVENLVISTTVRDENIK